jgi:hypothetical protein
VGVPEIVGRDVTTMVNVLVASGATPLVAVTVAVYDPGVVGAPLSTPPLDNAMPGGSEPPVMLVVGAGVPVREKAKLYAVLGATDEGGVPETPGASSGGPHSTVKGCSVLYEG